VNTPPDIAVATIRDVLRDGWDFAAETLDYQAVGFGSHHWLATAADGEQRFVTVDDLRAKVRTALDGADDAFARLDAAFTAVGQLYERGLEFVVAPIPDRDRRVLRRLSGRFSLVVHPMVDGERAGEWGEYRSATDRRISKAGYRLIDWDTLLVAPPERDLWDVCGDDGALLAAYGAPVDAGAMALYRLWYDLTEIGGYLGELHDPHVETADVAASWRNVQHFLRPRARWPRLFP
jgi:hypothetical protein